LSSLLFRYLWHLNGIPAYAKFPRESGFADIWHPGQVWFQELHCSRCSDLPVGPSASASSTHLLWPLHSWLLMGCQEAQHWRPKEWGEEDRPGGWGRTDFRFSFDSSYVVLINKDHRKQN
jgi:hypothetical protein